MNYNGPDYDSRLGLITRVLLAERLAIRVSGLFNKSNLFEYFIIEVKKKLRIQR